MIEDAGSEQARTLLLVLHGHIEELSRKLEAAEERNRRAQARGAGRRDPIASTLRRDICEVQRLIDGLHRRFPETREPEPNSSSRATI